MILAPEQVERLYAEVTGVLIQAGFCGIFSLRHNDATTRFDILQFVSAQLIARSWQHIGFHIVCDETNNPPSVVASNAIVFSIGLAGWHYAEYVYDEDGLRRTNGDELYITGVIEN